MSTALESTPLTCRRYEGGIVSILLSSPGRPLVILDSDLLQRLDATLDVLLDEERREELAGLILCSDCSRVFVAGADLREIHALDDEALMSYLAFGSVVCRKLASLPCPTVACINGATLGGGLEIAMHCDALIASEVNSKGKPYPIGLPECSLGLLPGWGGTQMLTARIDPETALRSIIEGAPAMSNEPPNGLLDVVVATPGDLQAAAMEWIAQHAEVKRTKGTPRCLDDKHPGAIQSAVDRVRSDGMEHQEAKAVLEAVETGLRADYSNAIMVEQRNLVALRSTESTRNRLEAFFAKQS